MLRHHGPRSVVAFSRFSSLASLAAVVVLVGGCSAPDAPAPGAQAPSKAGFVTVQPEPVRLQTELTGRTAAHAVAEVRPRVSGIIEERLFREGDHVEAGQPLYQLDARLLRAAVREAEANRASAAAELANARLDFERYEALRSTRSVSEQQSDLARAELDRRSAALAAADAALETARIRLEYATIRAPIDGYVGRSVVTVGALVTAEQGAPLTTIRQLDPIYVDLKQPFATFQRLLADSAGITVGGEGAEGEVKVSLVNTAGGSDTLWGTLQFGDYAVDEDTGTVTLRALFPNPDAQLLPGLFVRARIEQPRRDAILVEQRAIQRDGNGEPIALVIDADDRVARRAVTLGGAVGNQWLVTEGLNAGDRLVVDGLQFIRPGQPVQPVDLGSSVADAHRVGAPAQQDS
jgi:membrane fusion protein (multidrug efflux system)